MPGCARLTAGDPLRVRARAVRVDEAGAVVRPPIRARKQPEMPETPTFGRYAEVPCQHMASERQEDYRFLVEIRGVVGGPS
jgi:hypothetical protein